MYAMSSVKLVSTVERRLSIAITLLDIIDIEPLRSRNDSTSSHFVGCFFAHRRERLSLDFPDVDGLNTWSFVVFSSNTRSDDLRFVVLEENTRSDDFCAVVFSSNTRSDDLWFVVFSSDTRSDDLRFVVLSSDTRSDDFCVVE